MFSSLSPRKIVATIVASTLAISAGLVHATSVSAAPVIQVKALLESTYPKARAVLPTDPGPWSVEGALKLPNGKAVGKNVPVLLYEWPSRSILARQAINSSLNLSLLAATVTDSNGRFRFPTSALGKKSSSEYRDVMVNVPASPELTFEVEVDKNGTPVKHSSGPYSEAPAIAGGKAPTAKNLNESTTLKLSATPKTLEKIASHAGCGGIYTYLRNKWQQDVLVGHTGSTFKDASSQFTYKGGVSTELGWGTSVSGKTGTWSQSGKKTMASERTESWNAFGGVHNRWYYTEFEYRRYEIMNVSGCYPKETKKHVRYEVKPMDWLGGATSSQIGTAGSYSNCVKYDKGNRFTQTKGSAMTWTNGVQINTGIVKMDLTALTGYSNSVSVEYKFTGNGRGCGKNGYPAQSNANDVVARPR